MKVFAFLFLAVFLVLETTAAGSEEFMEDLKQWVEECGKELEVPKDKMEEYQTMGEPSTEKMASCITACILEKAGLMEDDKLKSDKMNLFLDEHKDKEEMKGLKEIVDKCEKEASSKGDKCAIAGTFAKCAHDEMQKAAQ